MPNIRTRNLSFSQKHDPRMSIPNLAVYAEELDAIKNKPIVAGGGNCAITTEDVESLAQNLN